MLMSEKISLMMTIFKKLEGILLNFLTIFN